MGITFRYYSFLSFSESFSVPSSSCPPLLCSLFLVFSSLEGVVSAVALFDVVVAFETGVVVVSLLLSSMPLFPQAVRDNASTPASNKAVKNFIFFIL